MSTRKSAVQIEARDPMQARLLAARYFAIPALLEPEQRILFHPWWNPGLVQIHEVAAVTPSIPYMAAEAPPPAPGEVSILSAVA